MTPEIEEIIEQNKSLKDQLANLSKTHAKDRQRLDELLSDYVRDKKALADALGTDPIHWHMTREVEALKREAADWRAEHVRREAAEPTVASTYTKSYVSARFGTEDAPLELVTLKRGLDEIAVIPANLLREMFAELRPILDSENADVDLPDTAAQDPALKSNAPAVSG